MASVLRGQIEAARMPVNYTNAPPLEGAELALAQSISMISDLIVLATEEGRRLFDDADRGASDAGINDLFRAKMTEFLEHIRDSAKLIDTETFTLLLNLFSLDITAPNPRRVAFLQRGSARNLMIALCALGLVTYAAPTLSVVLGIPILLLLVDKLSGGGLSDSDLGKLMNQTVRDGINTGMDNFLAANRERLRELAKQPSLRWIDDVLDRFEDLERIRKDAGNTGKKE